MCVPRVHTYPFQPPLDGPELIDRDTSTGHARGRYRTPPPSQHKNTNKIPAPPLQKCTNKHPRGRSSSYSTHPRVRPRVRAHPRARWITIDATSAGRAGRVYRVHAPVTTHEKRHPTPDRTAHRHASSSSFPVVAESNRASAVRDARIRSIRSTPFDALERSIPFTTVSFVDVARPRRRARARRGRKPRASTDATDRRRRPTTHDERDEDESIRTQGRRYGTRERLDAIERSERARGGVAARRARPNENRDRGVTPASCACRATPGCVNTTHLGGGRARARGDAACVMFSARRYPCDA